MRLVGWSRIGLLGGALVWGILLASCSSPMQGPTIQIAADGWTANPETMVQTSDRFEITIVNSTNTPVNFIIFRMDYGDIKDIPLVDGLPDLSGMTVYEVYEVDDLGELSRPVVAYTMIHPGDVGESPPAGWEPASVEAGKEQKVIIGGAFGMGGGEPGSFAVISYEPGGHERGDFAVFNLTDENGEIPQMDLEDFCEPSPCRGI